jgi:hypothetical protein
VVKGCADGFVRAIAEDTHYSGRLNRSRILRKEKGEPLNRAKVICTWPVFRVRLDIPRSIDSSVATLDKCRGCPYTTPHMGRVAIMRSLRAPHMVAEMGPSIDALPHTFVVSNKLLEQA